MELVVLIAAVTVYDAIRKYLKSRKALNNKAPILSANGNMELGATNPDYEAKQVDGDTSVSEVESNPIQPAQQVNGMSGCNYVHNEEINNVQPTQGEQNTSKNVLHYPCYLTTKLG